MTKMSWIVGAAVLLMPRMCHAQVVARDTAEAWAAYERSVLEAQGIERLAPTPFPIQQMAQYVEWVDSFGSEEQDTSRKMYLEQDPRVGMLVHQRAAERAYLQAYSLIAGIGWLSTLYSQEHAQELERFQLHSIRSLPIGSPGYFELFDAAPGEPIDSDLAMKWQASLPKMQDNWVSYLHDAGFWVSVDAWSLEPVMLSPAGYGLESGRVLPSRLTRALAIRLHRGLVNNDPAEVRSSVVALNTIGWFSRLFANSVDITFASGVPQQIYNILAEEIGTGSLDAVALVAMDEALGRVRTKPVTPWIMRGHAQLLTDLDAVPDVIHHAIEELEAATDEEYEIEQKELNDSGWRPSSEKFNRVGAIKQHHEMLDELLGMRDEILTYTQARLAFWIAWEAHEAGAVATARTKIDHFESREPSLWSPRANDLRWLIKNSTAGNSIVRKADLNVRAELASCRVLIAAERALLKWGRWPEDLAEITPRLLKEVPIDPWSASGEPLQYRRENDGFVLWSIGPDGIDNSGKVDSDNATSPGEGFDLVLWPQAD